MKAFPDEYASRLMSAFIRIDQLLTEACHVLDPDGLASPFSTRISDSSAARHQLITDQVRRIRITMQRLAHEHQMTPPVPVASALQSSRSLVDEALIIIAEFDPRYAGSNTKLRGELKEDASRITSELMSLVETLARHLENEINPSNTPKPDANADVDCSERILLTELLQIISSNGLTHLRSSADALMERIESADLHIGIFGAVSAGKSSLVNCLLGRELLPVAAIPTTAVPVRVSFAVKTLGNVDFADAASETFELERLAEFADSHFNPNNARHVTRLRVSTNAPILRDGVTLIDMPGVEFQTLAADPVEPAAALTCDIALVLVSASSELTLVEAQLVDSLHRAGTTSVVLITKVDLVESADRWRIYGHVIKELWEKTHLEVPVYLVSTHAPDLSLCEEWKHGPFGSYIATGRQQRRALLGVQIDALRRDVVDALERRLAQSRVEKRSDPHISGALDGLVRMQTALKQICHQPISQHDDVRTQLRELVSDVAHNAAVLWGMTRGPTFDITELLVAAATARADSCASSVMKSVERLRAQASRALAEAGIGFGHHEPDLSNLPTMASPPPFRFDSLSARVVIQRPRFAVFGNWGLYRAVQQGLMQAPVKEEISSALAHYCDSLAACRSNYLRELINSFVQRQGRLAEDALAGDRDESSTPEFWTEQLRSDIRKLKEHDTLRPRSLS